MKSHHPPHALQRELERLIGTAGCLPDGQLTADTLMAFLGGYRGPHWRIDRRPQPLRGRRSSQRFCTLLRRKAVTRLRMEGRSFRSIGRALGISQVAAWKLWHQVVRDVIEVGRAERAGRSRLAAASRQAGEGDPQPLHRLMEEAARVFGQRSISRFLKAQGSGT